MSFELAFDNQYYYDTGFQIGELRSLDKPHELVLGERLSSKALKSGGRFHLEQFAVRLNFRNQWSRLAEVQRVGCHNHEVRCL